MFDVLLLFPLRSDVRNIVFILFPFQEQSVWVWMYEIGLWMRVTKSSKLVADNVWFEKSSVTRGFANLNRSSRHGEDES
jgi:hypothetical protein